MRHRCKGTQEIPYYHRKLFLCRYRPSLNPAQSVIWVMQKYAGKAGEAGHLAKQAAIKHLTRALNCN